MAINESEDSTPPGMEQAQIVPGYRRRVIVKFKDHVQLPREDPARAMESMGVGPWNALTAQFQGITLEPLLSSRPEQFAVLTERARTLDSSFRATNLGAYFAVTLPPGMDAEALAKALSEWESVTTAYVEPPPVEPPFVNAADDPRSTNQGYLDPAPDGIDAEYAWNFPGGDGAGQALVDMEWGWTFNHEDLAAHGITLISGLNHSYYYHGSAVLGEIAAVDNAVGCVGITPALASIRCVGQHLPGGGYSTAQPILDAIAVMEFGDVLLLEAQTNLFGYNLVPVEIEPAVFDVIRLATSLGIVVVEAGGNGGVDLDTVVNPGGQQIFNRASMDFMDSGAIIVGAASSTAPHARLGFSCHGSRIDCYGWGENVDTLSSDDTNTATNLYTTGFNGTSSASPIVTGTVLAVQGLVEAASGDRLAPWQIRMILSDPVNGTPSQNPAVDRIGVMPNLRAIIDGPVLNLAPDIYLRDFAGDNGDPHLGAISSSPDIILRQMTVPDPQAAFGAGSGTENDMSLGYEAEAGQDNFVYVRVRNRGGSVAGDVSAAVYWAPPSTLVTPDLWTLLGSTTLPNVPTGDLLTVSSGITWPSAAIPAPGHYCFVGILNTPRDPGPTPADFLDWDNFTTFIRNNNNVTWRNFNVINNVPPPRAEPPGYVALPFIAAGAPDKARRMRLEIVPRLPAGAEIILELPAEFAERLRVRPRSMPFAPYAKSDCPRVVYISIHPCGPRSFPEIAFPAKARIPLRLLVKIPDAMRQHEFELFARQVYEGEEVGRITWRLVPSRQPM
ncbi:Serine protease, subtilisin family [Nitrosospira briensis]|uniref:Serine protease, subtilisin family n=1 Tax=Nitrosospira briensis TaxID=35799 RepID=A0A1I4YV39_9PROT|nr:S8 family peptidase [Nitrosospira briensis]SFN41916.1 Serine protease, subtilisin family [Nitrosospira briensis]